LTEDHKDWAFRALTRAEIDDATLDAVLELYRQGFDRWPLLGDVDPKQHLRWKLDQPGVRRPLVVCRQDGDLAMTISVTCRRFHLGGEQGLVRNYPDMVVAEPYRKQGIGPALQDLLQSMHAEESDLALYDTEHEGLLRGARRQGARPFPNPVRAMVLPLRPSSWIRSTDLSPAAKLGAWPLAVALAARNGWRESRRRHRDAADLRVSGIEHFDERVETLWRSCIAAFDLLFERSREFLEWRYCDPRGGDFAVRQVEEGDRLLGYTALRVLDGQGFIADLLCEPTRPDALAALIADAVDQLRARGAHSILTRLALSHPYRACLHDAGFSSPRKAVERPLYRPLSDRLPLERLASPKATVHLTYGDADWF
jgi:GNAT superfamily N-acetyltransferase